ncbi:MAG: NADPH-dependent F420 reductase [Candidatus Mycalebacterium zealandia]|nr:MAG: NADPH-dependent F420 reductase [Candidatus Mycalebacterium zealandia]
MKISLLGGTGDIAEGLVLRWSKAGHEIFVGSRNQEKADTITAEYIEKIKALGVEPKVVGMENAQAAASSEVVVISIPPEYAADTIAGLSDSITDQIVITPVVPMAKEGKSFLFVPPSHGSSALEIKEKLPPSARLVSAYHNLPAKGLSDVDKDLNADVVICGDDEEAKAVVAKLTEDLSGLRTLDAGPLEISPMIEAITPLIVNLNVRHKKHFSVKFVD